MAGIKIWNRLFIAVWATKSIPWFDFQLPRQTSLTTEVIKGTSTTLIKREKKIKSEKIHQNSHFIVLLLFVHAQNQHRSTWYSVAVMLYFSVSIVVLTVVWNWAYNQKQIENAIYMHICNRSTIFYSILIVFTISLLFYK